MHKINPHRNRKKTTIAKNNKKNKKTKQKEITTKKKTKKNNKHGLCSTTPKSIHDQPRIPTPCTPKYRLALNKDH